MDIGGKERVGEIESSIDIYILPCVKQTASGKLLYGTGSPAWCSVMTWAAGWGWWEGGSRERGYIYIYTYSWYNFPGGSDGKKFCSAGDAGSIPGLRRSPGEGNGNPFPVFSPRESNGQRSLADYDPWSHNESDTTEQLTYTQLIHAVIQQKLTQHCKAIIFQ